MIGGGISGLSAAYYFCKNKHPFAVDLFEMKSNLGGMIQTISKDGFLIELGPDSIITNKPWALDLIQELSLNGQIIETNPQNRSSYVLHNHKLQPIPSGFFMMAPAQIISFLCSNIVSWPGKLRVLGDLLIRPKYIIDDESLANFVRRRLGHEVLSNIAEPLLAGIYGADPEKLSLKSVMPDFIDLEQKYGSIIRGLRKHKIGNVQGARYGLFVSLRNGLQTLIDRLVQSMPNCNFHSSTKINTIIPEGRQWLVQWPGGEKYYDALCIATSAPVAANLLQENCQELSDLISPIECSSIAIAQFGFKKEQKKSPLLGMGFVVPKKENRWLMASTFSSQKYLDRAPQSHYLLRTYVGGALGEKYLAESNNEIIKNALSDCKELLSIHGDPCMTQFNRYEKSMPQYNIGHLDRIKKIDDQVKKYSGLALAGNYFLGVGIPDCIHSAQKAFYKILLDLKLT